MTARECAVLDMLRSHPEGLSVRQLECLVFAGYQRGTANDYSRRALLALERDGKASRKRGRSERGNLFDTWSACGSAPEVEPDPSVKWCMLCIGWRQGPSADEGTCSDCQGGGYLAIASIARDELLARALSSKIEEAEALSDEVDKLKERLIELEWKLTVAGEPDPCEDCTWLRRGC